MGGTSLGELFKEGLLGIPVARTNCLFSQLERRELSYEESEIIAKRVALQRQLFATYEEREKRRKAQAILEIFPSLSPISVESLVAKYTSEEEAIDALTKNPQLLSETQQSSEAQSELVKDVHSGDSSVNDVDLELCKDLPEVPKCSTKGRRSERTSKQLIQSLPGTSTAVAMDETTSIAQTKNGGPADDSCFPLGEETAMDEPAAAARPEVFLASEAVGCQQRPQRKAAQGVARLVMALTRPEPRQLWNEQASKRHRKVHKRGQGMPPRSQRLVAPDCRAEDSPDGQHPPAKKPRLGRVKRCSMKAVDLIEIGRLRTEPGWSNFGCIFPDGFKSSTTFRSSKDIGQSCEHVCSIVGRGAKFWPLPTFKIQAEDCAEPIIAKSATGAWTGILARIKATINTRRKAGENIPPPPGTAIPGPEFFGLTNAGIVPLIEKLDPKHKCTEYWRGKQDRMEYVRAYGNEPVKRNGCWVKIRPSAVPAASRDYETETSEDETDIIYADSVDSASDADEPTNRWSAVDRARRLRARRQGRLSLDEAAAGDPGEDDEVAVLPNTLDPVTLQSLQQPAMSPAGHVMGLATWSAVLAASGHCPFTKQPLRKDQLKLLTPANIKLYQSRLILVQE